MTRAGAPRSLLVIGGTGIIGRELVLAGLRAGLEVAVVSRSRRGLVAGARHLAADAHTPGALAAAIGGSRFDYAVDLLSFTPAQLDVTTNALAGRIEQFLYVSSATVYGSTPRGSAIAESHRDARPAWDYARLKVACEQFLQERLKAAAYYYTIVRPYITYSEQRLGFGAWESPHVLGRIRSGLPVVIGDEIAESTTSVTHSSDLARGMIAVLGNAGAANQAVHIASDNEVTWHEIYEIAAASLGVRLNAVSAPSSQMVAQFPELAGKIDDRRQHRVFDTSKIRSIAPDFSFEITPQAGYASIIKSVNWNGWQGSSWLSQGRLDRLASIPRSEPRSRGALALRDIDAPQPSLSDRLKYTVGRNKYLYETSVRVRSLLRRGIASDYA